MLPFPSRTTSAESLLFYPRRSGSAGGGERQAFVGRTRRSARPFYNPSPGLPVHKAGERTGSAQALLIIDVPPCTTAKNSTKLARTIGGRLPLLLIL